MSPIASTSEERSSGAWAYDAGIGADPSLFSSHPAERLAAARRVGRRERKRLDKAATPWPALSPAARNAWLLLVTTKPPAWRDPLLAFPDGPPTYGEPHPGFFYPDPLGFWAEVRRWVVTLLRRTEPAFGLPEALSLGALVHLGDEPARLAWVRARLDPRLVLFLDEPAWEHARNRGDLVVSRPEVHHIPDPHRPGQVYEGFWARAEDGVLVGKSPQHPSTHRLYSASDMDAFLTSTPSASG